MIVLFYCIILYNLIILSNSLDYFILIFYFILLISQILNSFFLMFFIVLYCILLFNLIELIPQILMPVCCILFYSLISFHSNTNA